jgi:hypothetical protein
MVSSGTMFDDVFSELAANIPVNARNETGR